MCELPAQVLFLEVHISGYAYRTGYKIRKNISGLFPLYYDKYGHFIGAEKRADIIERELQLCGYFCIITSEKMTAAQSLARYKGRDVSEKLFRADKTFIGAKSESQNLLCHIHYRGHWGFSA